VLTLRDALELMGDEGKRISFVKLDVEGYEISMLRSWILDGLMDSIDQMQIEFHTGENGHAHLNCLH
jgi:hypothetical protein